MNITIFTDGSSRGNPGKGGWGAVCVYPKSSGEMRVDELGGAESGVTNNQMELTAAIEALKNFTGFYDVSELGTMTYELYTDSSYVINGITKWVNGWQKNGWITSAKEEVQNRNLWEQLVEATKEKDVSWKYIGGHRGISGNERCDEIATAFADSLTEYGQNSEMIPQLYKGSLTDYQIDILNIEVDETKSAERSDAKSRSKIKAYSYVSLVNGKIAIDSTWTDCEKRVKGTKNARYKKSVSKSDEDVIVKDFLGK